MRRAGLMLIATLAIAAGCNRGNNKMDQPLSNDLNLAAQQRAGQDTLSAAERIQSGTAAPVGRTTRRSSGGEVSGRARTTSGTYRGTVVARSPQTVTVKHTKRDAAIGAAAGAVIGAATSRDKVKGGLIGAAAGAVLGGVIGNNVDVQKNKKP